VEPIEGPGQSHRYVRLRLNGEAKLSALLNQLYVLIPVLDDDKHYWVGEDEVTKLLARGEGWLGAHPAKELIVRRYLIHRRSLAHMALMRLAPEVEEEASSPQSRDTAEELIEQPLRLNDQRQDSVIDIIRSSGAKRIADLGCGEGKLLVRLLRERGLERIVGVDASVVALERAAKRLKLNEPGGPPEGRVQLLHGALTYRDRRLHDMDMATLIEVIEHLDPDRLPALARVMFGEVKPQSIVVTTPNAEYNALFPNLPAGAFRHSDHRFEWTRAEFRDWVKAIEDTYGYRADLADIGTVHDTLGAPTQMAVFTR
jgi:3' terminal RNA ribose 2'-O-methyltransferase Hen1